MSHSTDHHWDRLFGAIGKVVCQWARLEKDLSCLLQNVSIATAPALGRDGHAHTTFWAIAENMDLRATVAAIKAVFFSLTWDQHFNTAIVACLNRIENELRIERNRIVHDEWQISSQGKLQRIQRGTKITREQGTGAEMLHMGYAKTFESFEDIEAVAFRIQDERDILKAFTDELERLPPRNLHAG